jgi:hypothetical protein
MKLDDVPESLVMQAAAHAPTHDSNLKLNWSDITIGSPLPYKSSHGFESTYGDAQRFSDTWEMVQVTVHNQVPEVSDVSREGMEKSERDMPFGGHLSHTRVQHAADRGYLPIGRTSTSEDARGAQPQEMVARSTPIVEDVDDDRSSALGRQVVLLDINTDRFDDGLAAEDGAVGTSTRTVSDFNAGLLTVYTAGAARDIAKMRHTSQRFR